MVPGRRPSELLLLLLLLVVVAMLGRSVGRADEVTLTPLVAHGFADHGEGPFWDAEEQLLYFVDITGHTVNRADPARNTTQRVQVGGEVGFAIPVSGRAGVLVAGVGHDLVYLVWPAEPATAPPNLTVIATVDNQPGKELNRFNDAKADVSGRLWAGTMGGEPGGVLIPKQGSLYSLETTGRVPDRQLTELGVSNGIVWSEAHDLMYFIDSPSRRIDVFDYYLPLGVISGRRPVFSLDDHDIPGVPDGMTRDADGNLWVAVYNGGRVLQVDPRSGALLRQVQVPANKTTSATFGGPDLRTLYVTTSRRDLTAGELAQQPLAGYLFAVEGLGVAGVPEGNAKVVRD